MTELLVKRLRPTAKLPTRAYPTSAGLDLYADRALTSSGVHEIGIGGRVAIPTGIAIEMPVGHYGRIAPKSGLALKDGIAVLGGVVDSEYRGEILVLLHNCSGHRVQISEGSRIAQLILEVISLPTVVEVAELDSTERASGGFGSTGTN